MTQFLRALGSAFSALAPFSLGFSMVDKLGNIRADTIKPVTALLVVKNIVTPVLTYFMVLEFTQLLDAAPNQELANIALLYGVIPTALGVAGYAADYQASPDLVSIAIVIGTLVSAPLLYYIANNVLTLISAPEGSLDEFSHGNIDAIISIISVTIVLVLFFSRKDWRCSRFLLTTSMLFLTLVSSIAFLINFYLPHPFLALLHLLSLHSARLTSPFLALQLLLLARGSTALTSCPALSLLLLAGPLLSLSSLFFLANPYVPPFFQVYSQTENILIIALNSVSLLPTLVLFFFLSRTSMDSIPGVQLFRHKLLLLLLAIAMFTSISHAIAMTQVTDITGALIALTCAKAILTSGQGIIFLAVFGLDKLAGLLAPLHYIRAKVTSYRASKNQAKPRTKSIAASFVLIDFSTVVAVPRKEGVCQQHQLVNMGKGSLK